MPILTTFVIVLPVWPRHSPERIRSRERRHAVEHLVHIRDDVAPVDDQRPVARHAQGDVQHRAVLGHVDALAGEHRVAPPGDAGLGGQLHQEVERFPGDAILRVVEVDAGRLGRQAGASAGVGGEELTQVGARDLPVVGGERAVRRVSLEMERLCGCHHSPARSTLVRVPPGSSVDRRQPETDEIIPIGRSER